MIYESRAYEVVDARKEGAFVAPVVLVYQAPGGLLLVDADAKPHFLECDDDNYEETPEGVVTLSFASGDVTLIPLTLATYDHVEPFVSVPEMPAFKTTDALNAFFVEKLSQ